MNQLGHSVTVFERESEVGGLLRFGIPDFKLDKSVVKRRADLMKAEGIEFKTNTLVGKDYSAEQLKAEVAFRRGLRSYDEQYTTRSSPKKNSAS